MQLHIMYISSLITRPVPAFRCFQHATLNSWDVPGYEAIHKNLEQIQLIALILESSLVPRPIPSISCNAEKLGEMANIKLYSQILGTIVRVRSADKALHGVLIP